MCAMEASTATLVPLRKTCSKRRQRQLGVEVEPDQEAGRNGIDQFVLLKSSLDRAVYEGKIRAKFGTNHELDLVIPDADPNALSPGQKLKLP